MTNLGKQANHTFLDVESSGEPMRPLDFPPPRVRAGVRVSALVVHPQTGSRQVCTGVIHREDLSGASAPQEPRMTSNKAIAPAIPAMQTLSPGVEEVFAYWPQRRLQDAIYGSVWACMVLKRHHGVAADDAARAAGVQPGSPAAPIVWEITGEHVAIKMVSWAQVHQMRGRLLEDPVKEVAAMQLLGMQRQPGQGNTHVLESREVLQDGDYLYSIMPYCRDGDLFGIVVQYAEESGGEIGMPEPVARHWFRQILKGLNHLQSQGICHRDMSLENILVDGDVCMIMDFGMCLREPYNDPSHPGGPVTDVTRGSLRRLIRPQGVCGKHNYMSPEIYANQESFDGFAVDMWAAGVILYIMLTGFPPYDQASRTDQRFDLIISGRLVEQLRNWDIFLSDEAGDLMQRMLRLNPRDRLTLAEVCAHPWVTSAEVETPAPPEPLPYY
mmetsp:Transcript_2826/g.7930  ORF Transcript_2826/g.7930 Transcript_2826/m.7930 type:complete len:441 (+) Transcript_2826:474-1796(+)|eukprot:CAMPEP_0168745448 /NCGR_PEP_ID=MMETSP0724-20121128/14622_1 /TAXON_ID=265536 /ORGANISM="Amphiprora sp., Strain CCMP467" /LENGTH=440 /DNA_ID=CAMNT_0008793159 /DNA_START=402 /DNA_END=1724 /DNA_ORIENTATION=+